MALIKKFDSSDLYDLAVIWGRADSFGCDGWNAIGEHLEQLSEDIGKDIEIDIVAICCDYDIAESAEDWWEEHGPYSNIDPEEWEEMAEDEKLQAIEDYLNDRTSVVVCEDGLIIWQVF